MKTKTSLWLSICTIVLCIGVMTFGVYSAISANLNIGGTLGFNMHDCMVSVSGTIYNLAEMTQDSASANNVPRTIERTIMGGESTTTTNLAIGSMYFFYGANDGNGGAGVYDIIFQLTFTNLTDKTVLATFPAPTVGDGSKITVLDAENNQEYTAFPYTPTLTAAGETGCSVTVMFALHLVDTTALFSDVNFNWTGIEFEEWSLMRYDSNMGWCIDMGTYNGAKVSWVPIAESTDGGTTFTAFDGKTYTTSNEECKPQSGNKYYFLSYNILPVNYSGTSNNYMSFNFYDNTSSTSETYRKAWYWDEDAGTTAFYKDSSDAYVKANDYSVSNIRNYLNGETAYRYYTTPNYTPNTAQKLTTINELYGLSTDAVFNGDYIDARSISDLYTNIQASSSASSATYKTPAVPTTTKGTGSDKLWLLSHEEYYKYVYTNTAVHNLNVTNTSYQTLKSGVPLGGTSAAAWWLRSPHTAASGAYHVSFTGGVDSINVFNNLGVRPAFQITISA